jgi:ribosomal RNA methyltransferase Nop2
MQKQGMPDSLDGPSTVAKKRKSSASTNGAVKKQKSAGEAKGGPKGAANSAGRKSTKGDFKTQQKPTKTAPAAKAKKAPMPLDDEDDDDSSDAGVQAGNLDDFMDGDDSDADDFANAASGDDEDHALRRGRRKGNVV